jgi:hypothetical protein
MECAGYCSSRDVAWQSFLTLTSISIAASAAHGFSQSPNWTIAADSGELAKKSRGCQTLKPV